MLACLTVFFNIITPLVTSIGMFIWLVVERTHFNELAYNWVMCDLVLCTFGSIAFLVKLERIAFEQHESSEAMMIKHDRLGTQSH